MRTNEKEKATLAAHIFEELAFYQKLKIVLAGRNNISFGEVEQSLIFYKRESEQYLGNDATYNSADDDVTKP